jgi:heme/copper-type cytochrome/quinol oxidase subunit 1
MPTLTRWFIKTALIYFILALLAGLVLASQSVFDFQLLPASFTPTYFHMLMVGWVTQLILGVVYWMFPKFTKEQPRGSEQLGWAVYGLLNIGLVLRFLIEPFSPVGTIFGWGLVLSAFLQWLAGIFFVVNTWARVKER